MAGASNAQSTAWAIQGLIAAGREPRTLTREGSRSPLGYLATLRAPDGSVRYSRTGSQTPVWVTSQALTALAGKPLPIAPVRLHAAAAASPAPTLTTARSVSASVPPSSGPAARRLNVVSARTTAPAAASGTATPGSPAGVNRPLSGLVQVIATLLDSVLGLIHW
jgi:hypothetical protein